MQSFSSVTMPVGHRAGRHDPGRVYAAPWLQDIALQHAFGNE
jgi:hypothetical protein